MAGKTDYDVVIVGAGISGINFAYRLQERNPELSYTILEGSYLHRRGKGADSGPGTDRLYSQVGMKLVGRGACSNTQVGLVIVMVLVCGNLTDGRPQIRYVKILSSPQVSGGR